MNHILSDFSTDSPRFTYHTLGPFKWGTITLAYTDKNGIEGETSPAPWEHHKNNILHIPQTKEVVETAGIFIGNKLILKSETTWINLPPVVAEIYCYIGDEVEPLSVFYFRDSKRAKADWHQIIKTDETDDVKIISKDENSIVMVKIMSKSILNDPDTYINVVSYLKSIKALYRDHNSIIEKWKIVWK